MTTTTQTTTEPKPSYHAETQCPRCTCPSCDGTDCNHRFQHYAAAVGGRAYQWKHGKLV